MPNPSPLRPSIIRFGGFEADIRAGELRKSGARIRMQEQPFQILLMLLERPAELVTREEIRQKLWTGNVFVDFEHGVNSAIARLREVLGDSADSPRYIETLPRRGYRFIAPVDGFPRSHPTSIPADGKGNNTGRTARGAALPPPAEPPVAEAHRAQSRVPASEGSARYRLIAVAVTIAVIASMGFASAR